MIAWARSGWIGVGLGLGLLACTPPTDPGDPQDGGEDFSLGEPRTCDDPAEGLERLADEAQERGFAVDLQPNPRQQLK